MKRITAIILALVMCMLLTVPAFAGTALNIRVGDAECAAGGTATVTVSLENNPGITYLSLSIVCDSTFTVSKATNGNIISSMTSGRQYVWACDENASGNGVLLTLQIDVPSTAETKDYPISVTVRGCNNYDEEDVVTNVILGTITVKCAHIHTENRAEQPATCEDVGYTAGVYCNDCEKYISGHQEIAKTNDHSYGNWAKVNDTTHKHTCSVCGKEETANHNWNSGVVTTQPTHLAEGVKTYTCSDCGATKTEAVSKLTAHTYGDWTKHNETQHKRSCACEDIQYENHKWDSGKVTTQPTHLAEGVKTYTCSDCGATKTETVSKLTAHTYCDWTKHNDSQHKRSCDCGDVQYEDHKWDSGKVTTQPTCENKGEKTYTCSVCGETRTEEVPVTNNHSYGAWEKVNDTTHKHTCGICGKEETANHNWDSGTVTTQPTHLVEGVKTYTCPDCGATKTEAVPKLTTHTYGDWEKHNETQHKRSCACGDVQYENHAWDAGEVTAQPTEDNTGIRTYTCTTCGATKEEVIPKLDHQHKYDDTWHSDEANHWVECSCGDKNKIAAHTWDSGAVTKAATCLEDGIMTYTCTVCGYTKTETVKAKGEHSVGEWETVREATCTVDGLKERKCAVCGEVIESEDIKATGHTVAEWVIVNEPTCTETGLKQQKCSVCGEVLDEETIPGTGHHFGGWTVENGALKRTCACGETETKNIDKKAEELPPSEDGIKVNIDGSGSLPAGTSVKTDDLMNDLSDTEKDEITNAVKVIVSGDNDIELVSIYDISLEFEGAKIQPDGTVKVELPIPVETDEKFDSYQVVYIDDNGVAHEMPTEVKDGKIIFTTDHFSKYAVVGIINTDAPSDPTTNINIIPYVVAGSVVILSAVVLVIILSKKRKRA